MERADIKNIRNFSIIAHIDHGKSTLADRLLEATGTIEARKMRSQVLDSMELERERGITIKMAPVSMSYTLNAIPYTLNLIDTPGHIDFSYEVSRALKAVEGVLLLVDSTQGVQAQTFTTLAMARDLGLVIVPVVTKIDSPLARIDDAVAEVARIVACDTSSVLRVSGKTGEGVSALLEAIVERIPPPQSSGEALQALIFDFTYSNHRGIIVHVRIFGGAVHARDALLFTEAQERFIAAEVGVLSPEEVPVTALAAGSIGYIVTGIKKPGIVSVGDTVVFAKSPGAPLAGYREPRPVVWASLYPESQDDFDLLRQGLLRLKLSDSSLTFEEEASGMLGRGFRCGFLGMLHLEIVTERLKRESNLTLIVTTPSITYEVEKRNGKKETVYSPSKFPEHGDIISITEPWVLVRLIAPPPYMSAVMQLLHEHEGAVEDSFTFADGRISLLFAMPLRELMRGFFDRVKTVTSGYGSLSYEIMDNRPADVVRLDVLVAEEVVPAFTRVVSRRRVEEEAERLAEKLYTALPRQLFVAKVQTRALGRIIASRTLKALRKDVTGYLYGGDVTRKMKLLEKQKRGKKKMAERGKVNIPHDVFLKMVQPD